MRLPELRRLLQELNDVGFVESERTGPTGIGHTLEEWLGVSENNLPIPDIGGRVEIKATRSAANNLITLFTFNRAAWKHSQADIIRRWGYIDEHRGRPALYSTVSATAPNPQGLQVALLDRAEAGQSGPSVNDGRAPLQVALPDGAEAVSVIHAESGEVLASWDLFHIVGKFMTKFERLLLVHAESRRTSRGEEFHFNEAHLLAEPNSQTFRNCFLSGKALIDIRMHHSSDKAVRNHGTGFRVREQDLPSLFGRIDNLLERP